LRSESLYLTVGAFDFGSAALESGSFAAHLRARLVKVAGDLVVRMKLELVGILRGSLEGIVAAHVGGHVDSSGLDGDDSLGGRVKLLIDFLLGLVLFGLARRVGLVRRRSGWSGRILSGIARAASEDDYQEQQRRCESKTDCTKKCGWGPPKKLADEKECDYSTPFPAQDLDFCEHPVT
jgi:hypothetical protein